MSRRSLCRKRCKDGRCAHCHLRPEDVLRYPLQEPEPAAEIAASQTPINPAFAKLSELLNKTENKIENEEDK